MSWWFAMQSIDMEALVFPNVDGTGYYRFGMDDADWGGEADHPGRDAAAS